MRPHSAMQQTRKAPLIVKIQRSARSHTALPAAPPAPRFLASQAAGPELHMADLEAGLPDALPLHRDATMNEQSAPGTPSGYQSPELGMPPHGPYIHYSPESPPPTHPTSPSPSGMRAASTSPVAPAKRPAGHPSPQRRSPRGRPASARDLAFAEDIPLNLRHDLPCPNDQELIESVRQGFGAGPAGSGAGVVNEPLPGFGDFFGASAGRPRAGIDSLLSRYNTARLEVPFAGDAGEAPFEAAVVSPTILGIMDFHEADLAPLFGQPGPAPPRTIRPRQHFMNSQRDPSTLVAERRMTAGGVFPDTLDTTDMPSPLPVLSSQSGTSSPSSSGYADIPPPLIVPASAPPPPPVSQPIGDESPRQSLRLLIKRKDGELSVSPGSSPTKVASCSPVKAPEKTETISQGVTTTPPKIGVTRHQGSPKGTGSAGSVKVVTSGTAEIPLADPPAARTPLPPTKMVKMEKRLEKVVKRLKESQSAEKEEKSRKDKAPVKSPAPQTQTPSPAAASKPGSSGHSSHSASTSRPPNTPTPPPDGRNKKVASRGRGRPQKITYTAPTDSQVEQMKKLKAGVVDLTSSNSILATARLDKIDWRAKLEMLPAAVQHELVSMLPATWRGEDAEGRMSLLPGLLSKTDMEWRKQVEEYQKNLLSGEYDTEVRRKYVDHALAQMDPWKVQNFEPLYGDLLRQRLGSEGAQPSPRSEDASTPE